MFFAFNKISYIMETNNHVQFKAIGEYKNEKDELFPLEVIFFSDWDQRIINEEQIVLYIVNDLPITYEDIDLESQEKLLKVLRHLMETHLLK